MEMGWNLLTDLRRSVDWTPALLTAIGLVPTCFIYFDIVLVVGLVSAVPFLRRIVSFFYLLDPFFSAAIARYVSHDRKSPASRCFNF